MLSLSIVTPSKKLITDTEVEEVFVTTYRGELNILEGHAPLMSTLDTGVLRYRMKSQSELHEVAISWGYLEISHDRISILAETAETSQEINVERAQEAKERAQKAMKEKLTEEDFRVVNAELAKALLQIKVAHKRKVRT